MIKGAIWTQREDKWGLANHLQTCPIVKLFAGGPSLGTPNLERRWVAKDSGTLTVECPPYRYLTGIFTDHFELSAIDILVSPSF